MPILLRDVIFVRDRPKWQFFDPAVAVLALFSRFTK